MRCGLLGEKLGHSYSKAIHERLGGYSYELIECPRAELDAFMKGGSFDAINVTIPYKKAVIPYCAALSPIAERIGSVNAVIRQRDGSLYGDNTDAYGFMSMVKKSGVDIAGRKAIVLGSGGASATICAVLNELNAKSVAVISRSGQDNYENIQKHADAEIIVNTAPACALRSTVQNEIRFAFSNGVCSFGRCVGRSPDLPAIRKYANRR